MPVNNYNPIVEGLINASGLAERIQRMTQARAAWDEEERRTKRREGLEDENRRLAAEDRNYALKERERKRTREDKATAYEDLERGIAMAHSPLLEQIAPGQTTRNVPVPQLPTESRMGGIPERGETLRGGHIPGAALLPRQIESPIESTVEHGGKRYAIRGRGEVEAETEATAIRRARAVTGEKLRQTAGVAAIQSAERNQPVDIPGVGMVPLSLGGAALGVVRGREANKAAGERGDKANAARVTAAGIAAGAREKAAAAKEAKDTNAPRRQALQTQIDALQKDANAIHAELTTAGAAMLPAEENNPARDIQRQRSAANLKGLREKVKGIEKMRDQLIAVKQTLEPAAGGAPAKYDPATGKLGGAGGGQRVLKYNPATGKLE